MDWIKNHTHYTVYIVPFPNKELVSYREGVAIIIPRVITKFKDL